MKPHLEHYPERISYSVIQDESVSLIALKNQKIDVLTGLSPSDFLTMSEDKSYKSKFHFLTPLSYQFVYLGFNSRISKLNISLRQAFAHLIPYDEIIDVAALGFGERTVGPMNPADSIYYNHDIELNDFNLHKGEEFLIGSGYVRRGGQWYDNNDEPLGITLVYQSGSAIIENTALILNDQWKKIWELMLS